VCVCVQIITWAVCHLTIATFQKDRWQRDLPQLCLDAVYPDIYLFCVYFMPSMLIPPVLWRCWFGGRKGIRPVKNWGVGCWRGYLSGARCRLACSPADACHCHSLSLAPVKSRLVLPFWYQLTRVVPDKGPLNGCVCVYVGGPSTDWTRCKGTVNDAVMLTYLHRRCSDDNNEPGMCWAV